MKKLLYTLLAVSIIFSACEKEEEETSNTGNNNTGNNTSSIVGKWNNTRLASQYTDYDDDGTEYYHSYSEDTIANMPPLFFHYEFFNNGELEISCCVSWDNGPELITEHGTWHLDNDLLIISTEIPLIGVGDCQQYGNFGTINLLTNTHLELEVFCIKDYGLSQRHEYNYAFFERID
jgi:hypothetical protein